MFFLREIQKVTHQLLTDGSSAKWSRVYNHLLWNSSISAILQRPSLPWAFQYSSRLHNQPLTRNIVLKTNEDKGNTKSTSGRGLTIIFGWMKAKGKHLDKYCNIYLQKGYDVITIDVSPRDMLFPVTGTQVVAQNLLDYLLEHKEYDRIMVHGFSVGAYVFGEFLVKLQKDKQYMDILAPKFEGLVFDSAADIADIPQGFPRAVASNPYLVRALELFMVTHLKVMQNVATKHYIAASQNFHHHKLSCPALLLVSKNDFVGSPDSNRKVFDDWVANGVDVTWKCWDKSAHCGHMIHHPKEYEDELNKLFGKIQKRKVSLFNTQGN